MPDYPDNWRELADSIKDRDGRRCAICRTKAGQLNAHHIEGRTTDDPANLITLCETCHLRLAHGRGKRKRPARFRGLLLLLAGRRAAKNRSIRRMNRRK